MLAQADTTLSKANRASAFDAGKNLRAEIISHGMESSISSGNWSIKRFRMERKGVTQVWAKRKDHCTCSCLDFSLMLGLHIVHC